MNLLKTAIKNKKIYISGIKGSSFAYLVSKFREIINSSLIVFLPQNMIKDFLKDLKFFTGKNIFSRKEELIYNFLLDKKCIYVLDEKFLFYKYPAPENLKNYVIHIEKGSDIKYHEILNALIKAGYSREEKVYNPGEFAVRGEIIDIFIHGENLPVRIELDFDTVSAIHYFSPETQYNINSVDEIKLFLYNLENLNNEVPVSAYFKKGDVLFFYSEYLELRLKKTFNLLLEEQEDIFNPDEIFKFIEKNKQIYIRELPYGYDSIHFKVNLIPPYNGNLDAAISDIKEELNKGNRITVVADNELSLKQLKEAIRIENINFVTGEITTGFIFEELKEGFIKESEITGKVKLSQERETYLFEQIGDIEELQEGEYVVHQDYGIGIYRGIKRVKQGETEKDFIEIEYANNAKMLVPFDKIGKIHRYIGDSEKPPELSRLDNKSFQKIKKRVEISVTGIARQLLELYAIRNSIKGFRFPADTEWQKEFELKFPYQETESQLKCMEEIKKDMESFRPMDRLLCGDSGYGKTELAVRAAFKAVMAGKQVALLCPTTILAHQHHRVFSERMKDYPVKIEVLSRLVPQSQQRKIIKELKEGIVDIIIGTHRLIQDDVKFKDLGLLIIDEEQKFGVLHKEKIKLLKKNVDVLTMTATPIPRTLYMSLSGIRDISILETSPPGRKPVITKIVSFRPEIIREAILRELKRGGQVFFLHNRVQSIQAMAEYLKRLVPEARIGIAHGQMDPEELELVMLEFIDKNYDVLVCTTIIESGIDLPNVNTIIVNRADTFGLAQLYQIRGRTGRSNVQSYAYLLIPSEKAITETAIKRLTTLFEYNSPGSGFKIAMRDLEIRGAGNIFGPQQHGNILAVGLEMYCKILSNVLKRLKGEKREESIDPDLNFPFSATIPDTISTKDKIFVHLKISKATDFDELEKVKELLINMYGKKFVNQIENIFLIQKIKIMAKRLNIMEINLEKRTEYESVISFKFKKFPSDIMKKNINTVFWVQGDKIFINIYTEDIIREIYTILYDILFTPSLVSTAR